MNVRSNNITALDAAMTLLWRIRRSRRAVPECERYVS
jgi:hypothetical protein